VSINKQQEAWVCPCLPTIDGGSLIPENLLHLTRGESSSKKSNERMTSRKLRRGTTALHPFLRGGTLNTSSSNLLGLLNFITLLDLLILINNSTISDQALSAGTDSSFPTSQFLELFNDIHPFRDFAEDDVFPAIGQLSYTIVSR
jgi:hypothetical protein